LPEGQVVELDADAAFHARRRQHGSLARLTKYAHAARSKASAGTDTPTGAESTSASQTADIDAAVALAIAVERAQVAIQPVRLVGWV
jgi:hypothetical protein